MTRKLVNILAVCQIFVFIDGTGNTTRMVEPIRLGVDIRRLEGGSTRIVGGTPASIKNYPFAVSIQLRLGSKHHCGGTYILPRFVLSAAHCMVKPYGYSWVTENPRSFMVLAGTTNLWYTPSWQIANTNAVLPHPSFSFSNMAHDIGLFRLTKTLRITAYVNYSPMPYGIDYNLFKRTNQTCTVAGWGKTSATATTTSDILRHVHVPLISRQECSRYYKLRLHNSQICAGREEGGIDACQGDSGGPLLCNKIQVGIVSWGVGCAAPNYPGVYIRLDYYLSWIRNTVVRNRATSNDHRDFLSIILVSHFLNVFVYKIMFHNL